MWISLVSAIPKWPGMRLVVIGHAGDPSSWQYLGTGKGEVLRTWHVHEVPGPLEWISADALVEQQRLLLDSDYQRRHLNRWVASEDRLTNAEDIAAQPRRTAGAGGRSPLRDRPGHRPRERPHGNCRLPRRADGDHLHGDGLSMSGSAPSSTVCWCSRGPVSRR